MSGELLKYVGFLLMLVDHTNRFLLSGSQPWMEQAGRAVFPIFALVLGMGLRGEGGPARAGRLIWPLVTVGVICQIVVAPLVLAGLHRYEFNVLFTMACGASLIAVGSGGEWSTNRVLAVCAALCVACVSEYGPVGALLIYASWRRSWLGVALALLLLSVSQNTVVPIAVPLMIWLADRLCGHELVASPRRMFAFGYVAQYVVFSAFVAWGAYVRA